MIGDAITRSCTRLMIASVWLNSKQHASKYLLARNMEKGFDHKTSHINFNRFFLAWQMTTVHRACVCVCACALFSSLSV